MKKILLSLLCLPSIALAAQQEITAVPDSPVLPSIGSLKDAVNLRLADIDENFDEIYPIIVSIDKSAVEATQPATLALTTDTSITSDQLLVSKYITNQGASAEVDITLPAVSYHITRTIIVEENQIIEVCPPTGEAFDLSGRALDANDCVESPTVVGSKTIVTRMQDATGTYHWSVDVVRGPWVDTGARD